MLTILTDPPRYVCQPGSITVEQIQEMRALMGSNLGLAAPQVGINARVFITYGNRLFVNPKIEAVSSVLSTALEGCLSLPGILVAVKRPIWVMVNGQLYTGVLARVILHEYDHLEGRLITDYL